MTINWYPGGASGEGDVFTNTFFSTQENNYLHNGSGVDIVAGQTVWLHLVTYKASAPFRTFAIDGVSALSWNKVAEWMYADAKTRAELWYATATATVPNSSTHSVASRIGRPYSSVTEDALSESWTFEDGYDPLLAIPNLIVGEQVSFYLDHFGLNVGVQTAVPYFVTTIPSGSFVPTIDYEGSFWAVAFDYPGNGFPGNISVAWVSTAEGGASTPGLLEYVRNQHNGGSESYHIWTFNQLSIPTASGPPRPGPAITVDYKRDNRNNPYDDAGMDHTNDVSGGDF